MLILYKKEVVMKPKCSISYFVFICSAMLALIVAFALSATIRNHSIVQEQQLEQVKSVPIPDPTVNSNSNDVVNDVVTKGYYIGVQGNYIVVYLYDGKTVFEETEIDVTLLEEDVYKEIVSGKYIESTKELYGFLENYSS